MGVPKQMMVATAVVTVLYLWLPSFTHEQRWTDPVGEYNKVRAMDKARAKARYGGGDQDQQPEPNHH
ncbi:OBG-type G domain-containing protein [Plasmodiophora brassicae]